MGVRLRRTPIPAMPLFIERLPQDVVIDLNRAIRTRPTPFTDDITNAEKVSNLESFRFGVQRRGTKNITEQGIDRAVKRGAIGRAAIYRLMELSLMHAAVAAENALAVQGVSRAVLKGRDTDTAQVGRTADAGIDLAHGLQRQRYFKTGLGDTLPAVVYGLSEGLRDEVISEDAPFIGVIGNDALSKQRFWTNAYRSIQTQSEQAIKAERVHALFEDPAYIEDLLRVRIPH